MLMLAKVSGGASIPGRLKDFAVEGN